MSTPLARFDQDFPTPAENLAMEEVLLDQCESSGGSGFLRFWESSTPFVVLGYAKELQAEVFRDKCAELGIPILRRCSGGGTVLQGPGCLNYALVLPVNVSAELETITGANRYIMERTRAAVARVAGSVVEVRGHTDLCVADRKFSGNSQRRKKRTLLFHGCFLIDFELSLISQTLRSPGQQPDYRAGRVHSDFLMNLTVSREKLMTALAVAWNANLTVPSDLAASVVSATQELVRSKYSQAEWNERF